MARPVVLTPSIHSSSILHRFRRQELKDGIAQFYDESSQIWEEIWGEHMHHGYYYTGKEKDHQKAQVCAVIGWFALRFRLRFVSCFGVVHSSTTAKRDQSIKPIT